MEENMTYKPKYETITEDLLDRIKRNDFSYDAVFCTEKQLSEQYDVSRITAKRAITDLEHHGILYRKRGVGSFVTRNAPGNLTSIPKASFDPKLISFLLPFDVTKGNLSQTIEVINHTMNANGYLVSLYISDISCSKEKTNIKLLLSQNISGLIYYPMRDKINLNLLNEFVFSGIPVVIMDKTTDCPYLNNVVCDNYEGGRLLTEHLINLGHRNIAFFTTAPIEDTSSVRNRFAGYLTQMQHNGISLRSDHLVYYPHELNDSDAVSDTETPFQNIIQQMYHSGVTAIIAENDRVAQLLCLACNKIGLKIPEDISICGFDNTPISKEMDFTTIHQDFSLIGKEACSILLSALSSPSEPPRKITVPVKLIPRNSTASPRI